MGLYVVTGLGRMDTEVQVFTNVGEAASEDEAVGVYVRWLATLNAVPHNTPEANNISQAARDFVNKGNK